MHLLNLLGIFNGKLGRCDRYVLIYSFIVLSELFCFTSNENALINECERERTFVRKITRAIAVYSFLSIILFHCNDNNSAHYIPSFEDRVAFKLYCAID